MKASAVRAVWWDEKLKQVCWLDTTKLPFKEIVNCSNEPGRVARAIIDMEIRGAPAIGVAAALAVAAEAHRMSRNPDFWKAVESAIEVLERTRPTARNLFWALERMRRKVDELRRAGSDPSMATSAIEEEAVKVLEEDVEANLRIGELGSELVPEGARILTHCNAGALATSAWGTALAIIRVAWQRGKVKRVYATETRPLLQGARLTVWELRKEGIPVTLITDNTAGYIMRRRKVDLVIVGADRVTKDGFVVNKIGTYMIALAAKRVGIPFYVAAPTSTIDLDRTIDDVIIEERSPEEVKKVLGTPITIEDVEAENYAFDITDPDLVTAIVTEKGIVHPPFDVNLRKVLGKS
ncbi:MAG: S-methyl-5-thioribose-1-phosphate isomerase [Desulfurococcaceae archaeon]